MNLGMFSYTERDEYADFFKELESLSFDNEITSFAVLTRLLLGNISIFNRKHGEVNQQKNYLILGLPTATLTQTKELLANLFAEDDLAKLKLEPTQKSIFNTFSGQSAHINSKRVFSQMLHEFSMYFIYQQYPAISSFAYLYRLLEMMSYCFPLLYVSCSNDFKGTYNALREYMSDNKKGELKFFETFLKKIFEGDTNVDVRIDLPIGSEDPEADNKLLTFVSQIITQDLKNSGIETQMDNSIVSLRYIDVVSLSITLRNRFFHNLYGDGRDNFHSNSYDADIIFDAINPCFANILAYIFYKIIEVQVVN